MRVSATSRSRWLPRRRRHQMERRRENPGGGGAWADEPAFPPVVTQLGPCGLHTRHPSWSRMVFQPPLPRSAPRDTPACGNLPPRPVSTFLSLHRRYRQPPLSLPFPPEQRLSSQRFSAFPRLVPVCLLRVCVQQALSQAPGVCDEPHPCPRGCVTPAPWTVLDCRAGSVPYLQRGPGTARASVMVNTVRLDLLRTSSSGPLPHWKLALISQDRSLRWRLRGHLCCPHGRPGEGFPLIPFVSLLPLEAGPLQCTSALCWWLVPFRCRVVP